MFKKCKKSMHRDSNPVHAMIECSLTRNIYMKHFSTIAPQLFYSYPILVEEKSKIDGIIELLEYSGVAGYLKTEEENQAQTGRPSYNPYDLFAAILLGFTIGKPALREIESSCQNDLRFIYILKGKIPDHTTISRFITEVILPRRTEIFTCITEAIFRECNLDMDICFIDGTKQEAKPNKYRFVWKPTAFHEKLCDKIRNLLTVLGIPADVPEKGIFDSSVIQRKIKESEAIKPDDIDVSEKALAKMKSNLLEYFLKAIEYEEKEAICGPDRNSYYKTDYDATAMCLKQDYYSGLGSNMHAAYSVQLMVSNGVIVTYLVSQERTDMHDFINAVDKFHEMYGTYPKKIGADAGYGCTVNYRYCDENGIKAFLKYGSWEGESSGRRPAVYEYNDNNTITCLGNRIGHQTEINGRHPKKKGTAFFLVEGCTGCLFMPYCRRYMKEPEGDSKIFEVDANYMKFKQQARDLLLTPEGIEMRVNRSCQVEGAFGSLKNNMSYDRFRRTSMDKVDTEMMLSCLGYNLRKYIRFIEGKAKFSYWKLPEGTVKGEFKKPSAKRLKKRVEKKRQKQPNELARDFHKHRKCRK